MKIHSNQEIMHILSYTKSDIFLWGCSVITKNTSLTLKKIDIEVKGIIDTNSSEKNCLNTPIFKPKDLLNITNAILIVQGNHCLTIYRQLKLLNLQDVTIIFDFDNGADKIIQTTNLYFTFKNFPTDASIKDLFLSSNYPTQIHSNTHINKIPNTQECLIHFNTIKNKYKNDADLQKTFQALLLEYLNQQINIKNLYIGCGEDYREDYLHSDLRALPHVNIICNAWELSSHIQGLNKVYTRHMLEHLTQKEAYLALQNWYQVLAVNGELEIIVPNFDLRAQQWLNSKWETVTSTHDEIWSVAGCWGWQRECDPTKDNYNQTYWDVHKSGYNEKRITMLLTQLGFKDINTKVDEQNNLIAFAYKR